jgi:RimJ/RimL family protein N-acetyltransferase
VPSLPSKVAAGRPVLRPHKITDLDGFTAFIVHPDSTTYMLIPEDRKTAEGAAGMLNMLIASYESATPFYSLTIADSTSDSFLGFCQLWPTSGAGIYEIVYAVLPSEHRRAVATVAVRALINHVLGTEDVREIIALISAEHVPSLRVAEKAGFVCQGQTVHHGREALRFSLRSDSDG